MECECQDYPPQSTQPKDYGTAQEVLKTIVVDFGEVQVYGKYNKTITEDIGNKETVNYEINESSDVTPIYQSFKFNQTGGVVLPKSTLKLKIYYSPSLPHRKDICSFMVSISTHGTIKVICKGLSIAPVLRASCRELSFVTWPQGGTRKKRLEVRNVSQVPAEFQIDCDRVPEIFKVEPTDGIIQPNKHIFVTITFHPTEPGIFSEQIFLLVLACEPLTFELTGLHGRGPVDEKEINLKSYNYEFDTKVGYGVYFRPIVRATEKKIAPPVYLNSPFIDFGRLDPSDYNSTYKTFHLKNTLPGYIDVTWPKGKHIFMVKPQRIQIPPGYSALLHCWFEPNKEYVMFSKTITGQVDWKMVCDDSAPLNYCASMNVSVTVQGNTYAEGEYPIGRIEIVPKAIKFPPCLPGSLSHQNFKIRNDSHMAAMFRLIGPEYSKIIVRPALGVVKDYAIVTAQFAADSGCEGVYVETWQLEINGDPKNRTNVKFMVSAGIPTLRVGEENFIHFDTLPPGTISSLMAPLRNLSSFHLKFQLGPHPFLTADIESGELLPHDQVMLTFKCKADLYNQKKTTATFDVQVIEKIKQVVGLQYTHEFTAVPNSHDFMQLRFGSSLQTEFYLFNFGQCRIQFKLNYQYRTHDTSTLYTLQPESGVVQPKQKLKVTVSALHVKSPGKNIVVISYGSEGQEESKEVMDIAEYTFGHLFGKDCFWKSLKISRLNANLKNMKENETKALDVHLPDCESGKMEYHVVLVIENVSSFDINVCLKRIQLCDCAKKQVYTTINKTKLEFDCPHREMLTMKFEDTVIYGNSRQFLIITANYSVVGATKLAYSLDIGDNRRIEFFFSMNVLPRKIPKISFYSQPNLTFRMLPVFVGRKEPPIQAFCMYNNTSESARYKADLTHVKEICEREGFPVLQLLNPEGEIGPYSNAALLFKFHPIRVNVHKVKISLQLEEEHMLLEVIGVGRTSRIRNPFIPRAPGRSSEQTIYGVIKITSHPTFGFLKPKETQTVMITVKTFNEPAVLNYNYTCYILNYNALLLRRKAMYEHATARETITEDEFIISVFLEHSSQSVQRSICRAMSTTPIFLKGKESTKSSVSQSTIPSGKVRMLADTNAEFTLAIGLACELPVLGGVRSRRYSMVVYNEKVVHLKVEVDTSSLKCSLDNPNEIVLAELQHDTISLSICVNIMDISDDIVLPAKEFFTCFPQQEMHLNTTDLARQVATKRYDACGLDLKVDGNLVKNILERIISETVFHKKFSSVVKIASSIKTGDYYVQYRSIQNRRREQSTNTPFEEDMEMCKEEEIVKFLTRPRLSTLAGILHDVVTDSVHETFKLDTQFSSESDHHIIDKNINLNALITQFRPDYCPCGLLNESTI
nr:unnamed protein product [Callosobruchus chinensis]